MKLPSFTAFGGSLGIDFINTVQHHRGQAVNLLETPLAVQRWMEFMVQEGKLARQQLDALVSEPLTVEPLLEFRHDVRTFLMGAITRNRFLDLLAHRVKQSPLAFRAVIDGDRAQLVGIPVIPGSRGLLSLIAFDWLELMTSGTADTITQCQSERCMAFFLNPHSRRKWCSMQSCGNRQKNARLYARRLR